MQPEEAQDVVLEIGFELHRIAKRLQTLETKIPVLADVVEDVVDQEHPGPFSLAMEVATTAGVARVHIEEEAERLIKVAKTDESRLRSEWRRHFASEISS